MEKSLDYVEQVAPFPMAQDLLLLAKPSIPEQVLVSALDDAHKQTPSKKLGPLELLDSEQPFAPFLEDATHGELAGNGKQETENGGSIDGDSKSVINRGKEEGTDENRVEDAGTDALESKAQLSDQKEDVIQRNWGDGEETDTLKEVGDFEPFSGNEVVILGNGEDGRKTGILKEGEESDTSQLKKADVILENGGEGKETDVLKEEKVFSDIADVQEERFEENRNGKEEIERLLEQSVGSSVNLMGEIETLTESEGVTKSESQGSEANDKVNGTGKLELLEEVFTKQHQEQESREGVKGAGGELSNQTSVDQDAHKLSAAMARPSEKKQLNGDIDASFHSISRPRIPTPDGQEPATQRSSTSDSNIVGEILYNLAAGDEEGRSRQRILAFAAKRYAANAAKNPEDHDALYNWALVLQESADNAGLEMDSVSKDALRDEACKKYKAATQLCPTLHEAYYNWAIAISDRAKIRGRTKEAEDLWKQACDRYDRSVQLNWNSPQAMNNWGLALQELGAIVPLKEKRAIVRKAIRKFRAAIQLQFDFHRAVYNLGTVLYGLAEDSSRSGRRMNPKELTPADLYSLSAVYIAAAHALKPDYPV